MHYTGMMAYHIDGFVTWDPAHVVASVLAAIVLGALALNRFVTSADRVSHFLALALFVGSVVSLHFTGMAAIAVVPLAGETGTESVKAMQAMAVAVAGVALIIAVTAIMIRIDTKASAEVLENMQRMALSDALTGLPNRVSFHNHLTQEISWAEQSGKNVAVIGIDLDRFKEINDLRGHEAGDRALKTIAERLAGLVRDGEFVCRIGGDEFAAVRPIRTNRI